MTPRGTHLIIIPSFNPGSRLLLTVQEALGRWQPVWVVIDGSTDGSDTPVRELARHNPNLQILTREKNGGKGNAIFTGLVAALAAGFTHVLTMDADGQHPSSHIEMFMQASQKNPGALIAGAPVFGPDAPATRLHGRKLSVALVRLETLGPVIADPLFGFRVYPAAPLARALLATPAARGYDFDPEIAVRLIWAGIPVVNLPAPCRYLTPDQGGVSHFRYVRDNAKMVWLHTRLLAQLLVRWPAIRRARLAAKNRVAT
ncbi:MAG TPA: glycosyltransferase family 2 protein [Opitutaceae bacterium]|jgi:glycosyltransferase involved in cell wall biosynthesis|nr:glycosyltransferase family 2 protein [Opitutaceae bacterium]